MITVKGFNVICPMKYPGRCELPNVEFERLTKDNKYKAMLIYPFKAGDSNRENPVRGWLENFVYKYDIHLFSAGNEPDDSTKFCKICRLMNAADFAFVDILPQNSNVALEAGYFLGQGKPLLYLCNTKRGKPENIYFDLSDRMVIKYKDKNSLNRGLERTVIPFLEKVQRRSFFINKQKEIIKGYLESLDKEENNLLEYFFLVRPTITTKESGNQMQYISRTGDKISVNQSHLRNLIDLGLINENLLTATSYGLLIKFFAISFHEMHHSIVEEFFEKYWSKQGI